MEFSEYLKQKYGTTQQNNGGEDFSNYLHNKYGMAQNTPAPSSYVPAKTPTPQVTQQVSTATTEIPTLEEPKKQSLWDKAKQFLANLAIKNGAGNTPGSGGMKVMENAVKQYQANETVDKQRQADFNNFKATDTSDVIYSGKKGNVTSGMLERWLNPDSRLSSEEKKLASEYYWNRRGKNELAGITSLFGSKEDKQKTNEERAELMELFPKISNIASGAHGFIQSADSGGVITKGLTALNDAIYGGETQDSTKRAIDNAKQNGAAYTVGNAAGKMAQYYGVNKSGLLAPVSNAIGGVLGKHAGNILADEVADVALDTIPEIVQNISEGKSAGEVTTDALKNIGVNALFNAGGEVFGNVVPELVKSSKAKKALQNVDALKQADEVIDSAKAVEQPEIETLAKQTENLPTQEVKAVETPEKISTQPKAKQIDSLQPQPAKPTSGELSSYANETLQKTDMPEEVTKHFAENPVFYDRLRNADTSAKATEIINSNDLNGAKQIYNDLLSNKDAVAVPLGYDIAKKMVDAGDFDGAVQILEDMSRELTKAGQFSQAAAIRMVQSNPMAAQRLMQKQLNKINETGAKKFGKKWKNFVLTDAEKQAFGAINNGDTEAIEDLFTQITSRIGKEYPATKWEKVVEATKTAMMLNPRTHLRNIASNTAMLPVRSLSDRVSALGQNAVHLFNKNFDVTQSLVGGTRAQKKLAGEIFDEQIAPLLADNNKWSDVAAGIMKDRQIFNDSKLGELGEKALHWGTKTLSDPDKKVARVVNFLNNVTDGKFGKGLEQLDEATTGSILENLRRLDYHLLGAVEDNPFVKANFVNRLASYMKAQGIDAAKNVPNEAIQTAYSEALKATFKDDNYMTKVFSNLKKDLGKAGEIVFPFVKTPANIAKRIIEYSPAGFVDTLLTMKGKQFPEVMDALAKNLVGTAGIAVGYELAKRGLINGALSDNKRKQAFEKQQGKQAFSINIGDNSYTFEWAQPAAVPFTIGATIYDATRDSDNVLNAIKQGTIAAGDSFLSLSPVQSLQEILGGGEGSGSATENAINALTNFPQRLWPAAAGATARTIDPTYRETYVKGNPGQTWVNQLKAKIPALGEDNNWWNENVSSKSLPASYDTWGNERKRQDSTGAAAFANYVNPGTMSNNSSTPIDSEIERLYDATGSNSVFPIYADRNVTIGDETKVLNEKEHSEYQRIMGQTSYKLAEALMKTDSYQRASDEEKVNLLSDVYSAAKSIAESDLFGKDIASSNKKLVSAYRRGGVAGAADFLNKKAELNQNEISIDATSKIANYVIDHAGGLAKVNEWYRALGLDTIDADKYNDILDSRNRQRFKDAYKTRNPEYDIKEVTSSNAIPYLRSKGVNDLSTLGELIYTANYKPSDNEQAIYNNLNGYESLGLYYSMKQDAKAMNPDGSGNSLDDKEMTVYLTNQGYGLEDINKWRETLGKKPLTTTKYNQYVNAGRGWTIPKLETSTQQTTNTIQSTQESFSDYLKRRYGN